VPLTTLLGASPAMRRRPPGRMTNLALLAALLLAFATGIGVVAAGSERGRWVAVAHGLAGVTVVLLIPWKTRIIRRGLRRARQSRWASLVLAALASTAILTGLGYATGVVSSVGGTRGMWLHVAAALCLIPLVVWHVAARPARPRGTDLSRRTLLRAGALGAVAAGLYVGTASVVRVAGLPGASRRFTGSYDTGSFDPASMPSTVWLDDRTPAIDPAGWRLVVADAAGERELSLDELSSFDTRVRAVLDCTGGWYAEQDWSGVPVAALVRRTAEAQSLHVRSATGYWIRFPVSDLDRLLLATRVGGRPLAARHGFPLRLVAPGRRGYWWVKWVDRIELQPTPWWWQPPFPVT
jgi:DMSO/TMAO reductase YedYZ molybdopterin-dependent catalytic subunit